MKKLLKATAAIMLSTVVAFTLGCKPDEEPNNGGGGNGGNGNNGGGDLNSHEYVDLGLPSGTLWATCNVGANSPEECGFYFAWGETEPKDSYSWSNYKYCYQIEHALTKYCYNAQYGLNSFTDNLMTLVPADDAATANWGSDWRTPTYADFEELWNNTDVKWTIQNGMCGVLRTAPNGNTLFFPAAGGWREDFNPDLYYLCEYWMSTLSESSPVHADYYNFGLSGYSYGPNRYRGFSVRPVRSSRQ